MKYLFVVYALSLLSFVFGDSNLERVPADPDVGKDMMEIVQTRGFNIDKHFVTTDDGYILTMFRIPNPSGKPVILQHGLLDSSYTWVNNYRDESLGYILADKGFDVWFGNNRGNRYGRNHTTLNPDARRSSFWDFTWDEMAFLDAPAMINYVMDTTSSSTVSWVGHSEGTIQMFAAASSLEVMKDNARFQRALGAVNLFVALAPVAYAFNIRSKLMKALAATNVPQRMYDIGYVEFFPGNIDDVSPEVCQTIEKGCDVFLMTICGPSLNLNTTRIQVYVSQTPAGTSTRNMLHWQQGMLVNKFQRFDFGSAEENQKRYGSDVPPLYDLSKLAVPTAFFYGDHDYLADVTDVERMLSEVPSSKIVFKGHSRKFAHLDYTWAYNANTEVYADAVRLLQRYNA